MLRHKKATIKGAHTGRVAGSPPHGLPRDHRSGGGRCQRLRHLTDQTHAVSGGKRGLSPVHGGVSLGAAGRWSPQGDRVGGSLLRMPVKHFQF